MHQWSYKGDQVQEFLGEPDARARADVIGQAIRVFGGNLIGFYFCFGDYDGISITEFPTEEAALACVMTIVGHGRVVSVKTTTLFTPAGVNRAIKSAHLIVGDKDIPGL
jgi:uncharacterized protein with GYD domain